jgi:predicted SnoaL-like aldol condensation-catalyzing enzyme
MILLALIGTGSAALGQGASAINPTTERASAMSQDAVMTDLFNRWEKVWNEGKFDLASGCVADTYTRHDPKGDREVGRDAYIAEVAAIQKDRPGIRVIVYDHSFSGNRAWFRFAFKWTDAKTGEAHTQAGTQVYRVAGGKLSETWISFLPAGTVWTDVSAQEHWTSPPPIR